MTLPTILLAAGGSGGHLFPAYALAEELGRRKRRVELATDRRGVRFGSGFPGAEIHQISSATITGRSPVALARTVFALGRGILEARRVIARVRPAAVIGFGGYPCFPPLVAARMRAIPTVLHEQNAVLGRANRMLARRVSAIATSFEEVRFLDAAWRARTRFTGNPVRDLVIEHAATPYPPPPAVDSGEPFALLVFGGSQGARFFSDRVPAALAECNEATRERLRIVQQCRKEDLDAVRATYRAAGIEARCETFFADLPRLIAGSHLVIGRAGASSVAELTVIGRPSILVPLPHALDNDQLQNATSLANAGGAWAIAQADLTAERLRAELAGFLAEPERLVRAAQAAKSAGRPDAVARLADLVEELAATAKKE